MIEELDEAESLRLISAGGIGRIAYQSRFGPAVLPVNYRWHDGAVVFRTTRHSALDEDLQTGISGGDYLVAFEIDEIDEPGRQGWSVLIQGPAHHVESEEARARAEQAGVEPWPAGERELFLRIVPQPRHRPPDQAGLALQVGSGSISMAPAGAFGDAQAAALASRLELSRAG